MIHQAMGSQIIPEPANHVVDVTKLPLIALSVFRLFCRRQVVRCVQIVEVEEKKKRTVRVSAKPRFTGIGNCFSLSLDISRIAAVAVQRYRGAVIGVESLVQAKAPVEHKTAQKCGRLVAMGAKRTSQGNRSCCQALSVVFDPTHKWVGRSQHRDMGRQRQRYHRGFLRKGRAAVQQFIDVGSRCSTGGIRPQSIGSERVDGDQNDIRPCSACRFRCGRLLGKKRQAGEKYPGYAQAKARAGVSPSVYADQQIWVSGHLSLILQVAQRG